MSSGTTSGQPAPRYSRSSSFARDFFRTGSENTFSKDEYGAGAVEEPPVAQPHRVSLGRSNSGLRGSANNGSGGAGDLRANMMRRRQSRRKLGSSVRSGLDDSMGAAAEAVRQSLGNGNGKGGDNATIPPPESAPSSSGSNPPLPPSHGSGGGGNGKAQRKPSWYAEALLQGGTDGNLEALLGLDGSDDAEEQGSHNPGSTSMTPASAQSNGIAPSNGNANGGSSASSDDEVLEQYRIMAHHEATMRVKENTGFDVAEYEKRRKLHPDPVKEIGDYKPRKIRPLLPKAKKPAPCGSLPKPEVPTTLPMSQLGRKAFSHRGPRVPDLLIGTAVRGMSMISSNDNEHIVRCLGCRSNLQVKLLATLVRCPECNTVSPASSTRR